VSGWSDGTSDSYSVRSAWDDLSLAGTGGDATDASGSSAFHGEHETLNVVGFQDQVRYRAQVALRRPRFTGSVILDGIGTELTFAPAPVFPEVLAGVPILTRFRAAHDRYWRTRQIAHSVYDPRLVLHLPDASADAPAVSSESATAPEVAPASPAPLNLPDVVKRPRRRTRGRGKARHA